MHLEDRIVGTFSVPCRVSNIVDRSRSVEIPAMLVDTGSEYSWVSGEILEDIGIEREKKDLHFVMANWEVITRSVGFSILHVDNSFTVDEVVFAQPGDLLLLGAHTFDGLNLTIDARLKRLVAAGPLPAA
jgi:predicted aspartyl protease